MRIEAGIDRDIENEAEDDGVVRLDAQGRQIGRFVVRGIMQTVAIAFLILSMVVKASAAKASELVVVSGICGTADCTVASTGDETAPGSNARGYFFVVAYWCYHASACYLMAGKILGWSAWLLRKIGLLHPDRIDEAAQTENAAATASSSSTPGDAQEGTVTEMSAAELTTHDLAQEVKRLYLSRLLHGRLLAICRALNLPVNERTTKELMITLLMPLRTASGAQLRCMSDLSRRHAQLVPTEAYLSTRAASHWIDRFTEPQPSPGQATYTAIPTAEGAAG